MATGLSVLILAKNEEKNIADCIKSVSFADELIIVDSGSEDNTCFIAESMGAKVYQHNMDDDGFAGQRNFALEKAKYNWVLYLDADERVTQELAEEILEHIGQRSLSVAAVKRINVVMGKKMHYGVYRPDYAVRLFPKDSVYWTGMVHEKAVTELPVKELKSVVYHLCLTNWSQYFEKFNKYTDMMAKKMSKQGENINFFSMHLHALFAFFRMYILQLGFLDGKLGFILCQYHYFYTLTKYVRLEQLRINKEKGFKK